MTGYGQGLATGRRVYDEGRQAEEPSGTRPDRLAGEGFPRVSYDISLLGRWHVNNRTGIFRVVEETLIALVEQNECDLVLTSTASVRAARQCLEYLRTVPSLAHLPFVRSESALRVSAILQTGLDYPRVSSEHSIPVKVFHKPLWWAAKLNQRYADWRDARTSRRLDIFHSPFYPLPRPRRTGGAQRYLTVYDLIPLRFPQFCGVGAVNDHTSILQSLRPSDWAICISQATKDDLCAYTSRDPARTFVVPLAASRDVFHPVGDAATIRTVAQRYGIPDAPYILSLNTLEPRKNIDLAIRSFSQMVRQEGIKELHFVLVGYRGWMYDKIFEAIGQSGLSPDRFIVTGYVPDQDLAAIYGGAISFVFPSFYEGFGLPVLEAMQCGTPVLSSNTSSLPEVAGDAAILLDPHDADGWSQGMLDLYRSADLRASMSARSRERASCFSWKRTAQETLNAYRVATAG